MNRLLLTSTAIALASCASARVMPGVHGAVPYTPPMAQTIVMGAETLYGFGGYHLSGVSFSGLKNGIGAASNDLRLDSFGNGMGGDIEPYVAGESYGGASPAWVCPTGWPTTGTCDYTATISDGLSSGTMTIVIAPHVSHVKSHYGFSNGNNPDNPAAVGSSVAFQLATVLNSAANIHLGDTVIMRAGYGEIGATPALNPLNMQSGRSTRYAIKVPVTSAGVSYTQGGGSYLDPSPTGTGASRIRIQCEAETAGLDPNGNPIRGGNCDIGGLVITSSASFDFPLPLDFHGVNFRWNHPILAANTIDTGSVNYPEIVDYNGGFGYGVGFYDSRFETGPNVAIDYSRMISVLLLRMRRGTLMNSHLVGGNTGISESYPQGSTPSSNPHWTIAGNTFEGMASDGIDYGPGGGADASNNWNFNYGNGSPNAFVGDEFVITDGSNNKTAYLFTTASPPPLGTIPWAPNGHVSAFNAACTINGGGTMEGKSCVAGVNYPAGEAADPNVTAASSLNVNVYQVALTTKTNNVVASLFNVNYGTALTGSGGASKTAVGSGSSTGSLGTAGSTTGYFTFFTTHSDSLQLIGGNVPGLNAYIGKYQYNMSARNVGVAGSNGRSLYFHSNITACCLVGADIRWNLGNLPAAQGVWPSYVNAPIVSFNTVLSDVNANTFAVSGGVPQPGFDTISNTPWYGVIPRTTIQVGPTTSGGAGDGGGGATITNNLSNGGLWSYQTGAAINGNAAGSLNIANNQFINWLSSTGGAYPASGGPIVGAYYASALPNFPPVTTIINDTNPAAHLRLMTPAQGNLIVGGIVSGASTSSMTATCGAGYYTPPVNMPINGPGLLNGNVVTTVSACVSGSVTLGLLNATTGAGSGNYGTGAMNPDGTYNGALLPVSNDGQVRRNDGQVFDPASTAGTVYPIAAPATP